MKIVFFGLGSIGRRHAKLILENFSHEIFAFRSNKLSRPNDMGIPEIHSWEKLKNLSPDVAFITNPTYLHIKTAIKCAKLGINLFIEKPIDCKIDKLNELRKIVEKKKLSTYIAYVLRFHPIIEQIKKKLINKKLIHARILTSSFLPAWRPNKHYSEVYSANKRKGGGVILDLSHEIDYCQYLFGDILKMQGIFGKISNLNIKSEDYADIILRCKKGIINLHLNFFSRNTERKIVIDFKDSNYIKADLEKSILIIGKDGKEKKYKYKVDLNDVFLIQLKYFFKNLKNRKMMNNLMDADRLFRKIITFKAEGHYKK